MKQIHSKTRRFGMLTFAATTLLSAAWSGPGSAQDDGGITPGQWVGGDISDSDPYYACLNVSADGRRLTAQDTECRGNQGQFLNSIDIQYQGGVTPDGERCNQYSYRNLDFGDIAIKADNTFTTTFENYWVTTTIDGTFDPAAETVAGTVVTQTRFAEECSVNWEAQPVTAFEGGIPPAIFNTCCFFGTASQLNQNQCSLAGGTFIGNVDPATNPCQGVQ